MTPNIMRSYIVQHIEKNGIPKDILNDERECIFKINGDAI